MDTLKPSPNAEDEDMKDEEPKFEEVSVDTFVSAATEEVRRGIISLLED